MRALRPSAGLSALRRRTAGPSRPLSRWLTVTWPRRGPHHLAGAGGGGDSPALPAAPGGKHRRRPGPGPGGWTLASAVSCPTVVWGTAREGRRAFGSFSSHPPPALRAVTVPSPVTGRLRAAVIAAPVGGEEGTESPQRTAGGSSASDGQLLPRPDLFLSSSRSSPLLDGGWAAGTCLPCSPPTPRGPVGWYGPAVSVCQLPAATGRAGAGSPEPRWAGGGAEQGASRAWAGPGWAWGNWALSGAGPGCAASNLGAGGGHAAPGWACRPPALGGGGRGEV